MQKTSLVSPGTKSNEVYTSIIGQTPISRQWVVDKTCHFLYLIHKFNNLRLVTTEQELADNNELCFDLKLQRSMLFPRSRLVPLV